MKKEETVKKSASTEPKKRESKFKTDKTFEQLLFGASTTVVKPVKKKA